MVPLHSRRGSWKIGDQEVTPRILLQPFHWLFNFLVGRKGTALRIPVRTRRKWFSGEWTKWMNRRGFQEMGIEASGKVKLSLYRRNVDEMFLMNCVFLVGLKYHFFRAWNDVHQTFQMFYMGHSSQINTSSGPVFCDLPLAYRVGPYQL